MALLPVFALAQNKPRAEDVPPAQVSAAVREATALGERGQRALIAGNLDLAVDEMRRSLETTTLPWVVFNMGQAYWAKGDCQAVRHYFEIYLNLVANEPHLTASRDLARDKVDECRVLQEQGKVPERDMTKPILTVDPAPPTASVPNRIEIYVTPSDRSAEPDGLAIAPAPRVGIVTREYFRTSWMAKAGWCGIGLGTATVVFGMVVRNDGDSIAANANDLPSDRRSLENRRGVERTDTGEAIAVAGVVTVGAGILLLLLEPRSSSSHHSHLGQVSVGPAGVWYLRSF